MSDEKKFMENEQQEIPAEILAQLPGGLQGGLPGGMPARPPARPPVGTPAETPVGIPTEHAVFVVPGALLQAVVDYLTAKPYREVAGFIQELAKIRARDGRTIT